MKPSQYAEKLVTKTLHGGDVYQDFAPNQMFIKKLDVLICHSVHKYWRCKKDASFYNHAFQVTSLLRLQGHDLLSKRTSETEQTSQN